MKLPTMTAGSLVHDHGGLDARGVASVRHRPSVVPMIDLYRELPNCLKKWLDGHYGVGFSSYTYFKLVDQCGEDRDCWRNNLWEVTYDETRGSDKVLASLNMCWPK